MNNGIAFRVIIVENDSRIAADLKAKICSAGGSADIAQGTKDLQRLIQSRNVYDAASLDTLQDDYRVLDISLPYVRQKSPGVNPIVYSVYAEEVRVEAIGLGAVDSVSKIGDADYNRYLKAITKAAYDSQEARLLHVLDTVDTTPSEATHLNEVRRQHKRTRLISLYGVARRVAYRLLLARDLKGAEVIMGALKHAEQWRTMSDEYLTLRWEAKLAVLCDMATVTPDQLACILSISTEQATSILAWDFIHLDMPADLSLAMKSLLSILDTVLTASSDNAETMVRLWHDPKLFELDIQMESGQPPWHNVGLCNYLTKNGRQAIGGCNQWLKA